MGAFALGVVDPATAAVSGRPWTIPALRQWRAGRGTFRLARQVTVHLRARDAERLRDTAEILAEDLRAFSHRPVRVIVTSHPPAAGSIALRLGAGDHQLGREGYRLHIGDAIVVTANQPAGAFYGTRSVVQLLGQSLTIPAGQARDWPRYPQRGLMIDLGRKPFSVAWLADRIRELAFLKLNYLHLHFTDDLGWRIESDQRPQVHSRIHLTKRQVRDLVDLAARHQITVVPEIDMPGHFTEGLRHHPELQLTDPLGQANVGKLDYTLPGARRFARDLVTEYLPLFPGPFWHLGGDEYLTPAEYFRYPQLAAFGQERHGASANAHDGTISFLNELAALVKRQGKTPRAWADGISGGNVARLDRDVVAEWWTDVSPLGDQTALPGPTELLDRGYRIFNCSFYPTYFFYRSPPLQPQPDLQGFYEGWGVHRFRGAGYLNGDLALPYEDVARGARGNLGAKLHLWNDDPTLATPAEEAAGILPRLRIMAQQTWESSPLVPTYDEFERVINRVGGAPR